MSLTLGKLEHVKRKKGITPRLSILGSLLAELFVSLRSSQRSCCLENIIMSV